MSLQDLNVGETREIFWNAPQVFKEHFFDLFGFFYAGAAFFLFALWGLTIVYPLYRW